jgi:hypothetical protein
MKKSVLPFNHSIILGTVLIACLLFAVSRTQAAAGERHTLDESLLLMVSSELWLTGGGEPMVAMNGSSGLLQVTGKSHFGNLMGPIAYPAGTVRQTEVSINTVKEVIAMKQAAHEQSTSMLEGNVSEETLKAHQEKYDQEMKILNNSLEELRKQWRREKRFLPKLLKPFKQAGGWFWHKIGPAGRQILRAVGDDIIKMAVAGDPISGRVLRMLIVKHARALGEERGKQFLVRLLSGRRPQDQQQTDGAPGEPEDMGVDETEDMTLDEFWKLVYEDLVSEQLHCNESSLQYYKTCIEAAANRDDDWETVFESCQEMRGHLVPYPKQAVLEDYAYFHRDNDNYFTLTYDMNSGTVSGRYDVFFLDYGSASRDDPDVEPCLVSLTYGFTGRIDEASCSLGGNGTYTMALEGSESSECFWLEPYEGTTEKSWRGWVDNGKVHGEAAGLSFNLNFEEHAK